MKSRFKLQIVPVDPAVPVSFEGSIAKAMPQLDEDLRLRAQGYWHQAKRLGMEDVAKEFLHYLGEGFIKPFDRSKFEPKLGDLFFREKVGVLNALDELSLVFRGRISAIVWESLAYLGTRPDPTKFSTILAEQDRLPLPYYIIDTVLHAHGKVYGLKHHIDSVIYRHSGMVFEHNCDCSCGFYQPPKDGGVAILLSPERFPEATAALFSHLVSESILLMGLKMPFEMGLSPEAAEAIAAGA